MHADICTDTPQHISVRPICTFLGDESNTNVGTHSALPANPGWIAIIKVLDGVFDGNVFVRLFIDNRVVFLFFAKKTNKS